MRLVVAAPTRNLRNQASLLCPAPSSPALHLRASTTSTTLYSLVGGPLRPSTTCINDGISTVSTTSQSAPSSAPSTRGLSNITSECRPNSWVHDLANGPAAAHAATTSYTCLSHSSFANSKSIPATSRPTSVHGISTICGARNWDATAVWHYASAGSRCNGHGGRIRTIQSLSNTARIDSKQNVGSAWGVATHAWSSSEK